MALLFSVFFCCHVCNHGIIYCYYKMKICFVGKFIRRGKKRILHSKLLVHKSYSWWSRAPCGWSHPQTVIKFVAWVSRTRSHRTAAATQWAQNSCSCFLVFFYLYCAFFKKKKKRLFFPLIISAVEFVHLCMSNKTSGSCLWFIITSRHDTHCIVRWVSAMDAL